MGIANMKRIDRILITLCLTLGIAIGINIQGALEHSNKGHSGEALAQHPDDTYGGRSGDGSRQGRYEKLGRAMWAEEHYPSGGGSGRLGPSDDWILEYFDASELGRLWMRFNAAPVDALENRPLPYSQWDKLGHPEHQFDKLDSCFNSPYNQLVYDGPC